MVTAVLAPALKPFLVCALVGLPEFTVKTRVSAVAAEAIVAIVVAVGKRGSERRAQCERGCRQDYLVHGYISPVETGPNNCGQVAVVRRCLLQVGDDGSMMCMLSARD
jgi:hypothetical protein